MDDYVLFSSAALLYFVAYFRFLITWLVVYLLLDCYFIYPMFYWLSGYLNVFVVPNTNHLLLDETSFHFSSHHSTLIFCCCFIIMNLQEPVSHVVARPSPSDILEWRKFLFIFVSFSEIFIYIYIYIQFLWAFYIIYLWTWVVT